MRSSRRNFLRSLSTASLAAIAIPSIASKERLTSPVGKPDEEYWKKIRIKFPIADGRIMFNAANLCPSPDAVHSKVWEYQEALMGDVSMQFRAGFAERRKKSIALLAKFMGADPSEVGITRNTSESNCTIIHGLDLKAGDEIILWDQNHPSNKEIWEKKAIRNGIVIKMVSLPKEIASPSVIFDAFKSAFTAKTKMIAFSHISNISGIALPAKDLCSFARSKSVLSLVDGAQTLGFHEIDVKDLGCDFYTASTHKWLMGPMENGVLYMKKEHVGKVWPNIIGGGWHDNQTTVDDKICFLGQRNEPTAAALPEMVEFHETIGRKNIYDRVVELNTHLKEGIRKKLPKATFVTPIDPAMSGGIVIVSFPNVDPKMIVQKLYDDYSIAAASVGAVRLSPHIYNSLEEVDKVVDSLLKITT